MTGLIALQTHNALNLHFSPSVDYDYVLYNGKTKLNADTLKKHPYKWQYAGLEKKAGNNLIYLMYAIFKDSEFGWVKPKKLFARSNNKEIASFVECMTDLDNNWFVEDCQFMKEALEKEGLPSYTLFDEKGMYPRIYTMYRKEEIHLETLLLLDMYVQSVLMKDRSKDVLFWPSEITHLNRVSSLLSLIFNRVDVERAFKNHYLI